MFGGAAPVPQAIHNTQPDAGNNMWMGNGKLFSFLFLQTIC